MVTMAEIAKMAGVSVSTVSRALANNPAINIRTRTKIAALAAEHGFRPNIAAQNLRMKRSRAIGVVIPLGHEVGQQPSDPFFIGLLGCLADELTERGYDLLLSRVIPADPEWLDRLADSGRVDGLILIGQSNQIATIDRVAARYTPMVVWGARYPGQIHCSVGSDNEKGGEIATRCLINKGRKRLMYLGHRDVPEFEQRESGFWSSCREAGIAEAARILPIHLTSEAAYQTMADYFSTQRDIDGIIAATDVIALSAIRALTEHGLSVPNDVSVIGYDDIMLAQHMTPPLTTIRQDIDKGAELLVDIVFRQMDGERCQSIVLEPDLIVRGSA